MSFDKHATDTETLSVGDRLRSLGDRLGFAHLLASTVVLVAATILLGVAAKATGSGLACDANWPLCDGGLLNLFPANFPSFFEWIHRVVAMVAGFWIVGTALVAWLDSTIDRLVTIAVTIAMVLTPIQVILGRETVLRYELTILSLHFWVAVLIFTLFTVAAVLVWRHRLTGKHVTGALGLGALTIPLHVALSPIYIGTYTAVVQTAQYAVVLSLLFAIALATLVGWERYDTRSIRALLVACVTLGFLVLLLGRRSLMTFAPVLDLLYFVSALVLFFTLLSTAVLTHRISATKPVYS